MKADDHVIESWGEGGAGASQRRSGRGGEDTKFVPRLGIESVVQPVANYFTCV
jgi:hypothetical protein